MTNSEIIKQSAFLISNDFGLELFDHTRLTEKTLLESLMKVIQHFLDNDLNQLLNILYRIDISKIDVKKILTTSVPGEMSRQLAEKILERERKKAETRLGYSA